MERLASDKQNYSFNRQTDEQTDGQTDRQTNRQTNKHYCLRRFLPYS